MARKIDWIIGIALAVGTLAVTGFIGLVIIAALLGDESDFSYASGDRIGVVEINGVISDADEVVAQIVGYREDDSIPAIVLRINSPGGVVAPTQEIYEALNMARRSGKIIIASMGSVAASGGYYVACAADSIMANPGTLTGSIGVIFEVPNASGLYEKIGIDWQVIKSGVHKDIGSSARKMTSQERGHMQAVVDDTFEQFVNVVLNSRPLNRSEVLEVADGRVFTGNQAKGLGLVDRLGTYQDALNLAAEMSGMTGTPNVVKPKKKSIFDLMVENMESVFQVPTSVFLEYRLR